MSRPDARLEVIALLVTNVRIVGHAGLNSVAGLSPNCTGVVSAGELCITGLASNLSRVGVAGLVLVARVPPDNTSITLARLSGVHRIRNWR